jgi:hypothetical protein
MYNRQIFIYGQCDVSLAILAIISWLDPFASVSEAERAAVYCRARSGREFALANG